MIDYLKSLGIENVDTVIIATADNFEASTPINKALTQVKDIYCIF